MLNYSSDVYVKCYYSVLLLLINGRSVVTAARIQVIFTVGKVLALGVIIVGGIVKLAQGSRIISSTFKFTIVFIKLFKECDAIF